MRKLSKTFGFTLLELLIVLAIFGNLASITIPAVLNLMQSQEEKIEQVEQHLEKRQKKVEETTKNITERGDKL